MALKPPPSIDQNARGVILYPNQKKGFGYSQTARGLDGESLSEGYERTINMDARHGSLSPSFAVIQRQAPPGAGDYRAYFAVPWTTTNGVPEIIYSGVAGGATIGHVRDGDKAQETDATTAVFGSAAFYDDGGGHEAALCWDAHGQQVHQQTDPGR